MRRHLWLAIAILSVLAFTVFLVGDVLDEAWPMVVLDLVLIAGYGWVIVREIYKARAARAEASE